MSDFFSKYLFFDDKHHFSLPVSRPKPRGGIENVSPLEYRVIFGLSCQELTDIADETQLKRCAGCGVSCKADAHPFISWRIDEINSIITPIHFHLVCINCLKFLHSGYMEKDYDRAAMEFKQRTSLVSHNIGKYYHWPNGSDKASREYNFWVQQDRAINRLTKEWKVKSVLPQMTEAYGISSARTIENITADKMILFIQNHCSAESSSSQFAFSILPAGDNLPAIEMTQEGIMKWLCSIPAQTSFKLIGENIHNKNLLTLALK